MKVKVYDVNTTDGKRYGLMNAKEGFVLSNASSKWKTAQGARKYAEKMGYEVV